MLAVATGWTPDVLADLPETFRRACHWTLYAQALVGAEGLPDTAIPRGGFASDPDAVKRAIAVSEVRKVLFPDG